MSDTMREILFRGNKDFIHDNPELLEESNI